METPQSPETTPKEAMQIVREFAEDFSYETSILTGTDAASGLIRIQFRIPDSQPDPLHPENYIDTGTALTHKQNEACAQAIMKDLQQKTKETWLVTAEYTPVHCIRIEKVESVEDATE